jgi:4-hydroxy-2-oxoheptanedioate aldolase
MPSLVNAARACLQAGEVSLGVNIRFSRSVEIAKAMKTCGYEWLFIDLEHGAMSVDSAAQICVAALDAGIAPLVRVPSGEYGMATRILDNGALGIIVPHVDTVEEAREAVQRLKFPPLGHRSVASSVPHFDFQPIKVGDSAQILNRETLVVVMLETPTAIGNADAIAAVDGIDVVMIGTNDLCAELGIHGQFADPRVVDAYRTVVEASNRHGKWPGMGGVYAEDLMLRYIGMGMKFILSGTDLSFMMAGARSRVDHLRNPAT